MSADSGNKPKYKDTLQLPTTDFPMRAGLVESEPIRLDAWEKAGLYDRIQEKGLAQNRPVFLLHDGPPFANGDAHMGTALNKILKDLILKSKTMAGFRCPYVPGWDCHGLPIEFKVVQENPDLDPAEIRTQSEAMANKFIDVQRGSFRRLGVFGDWNHPYLTMDPAYEADIIRTFADFVDKDLVYRDRKPVLWSYGAKTALAEAEVDYKEKTSPATFVAFAAATGLAAEKGASFVIWTTTPWTLPANSGIALHPRFDYAVGTFTHEDGRSQQLVLAKDLLESFASSTGFELDADAPIEVLKGADLAADATATHPFLEGRTSKLITAEFVTAETGTGAVHIAPGHGQDDYVAGRENGLELYSPVDDDGLFTDESGLPELVGVHVFKANKAIIELLAEKGALLGEEAHRHEYPHCWRSKTPIIFRSVPQFFIKIDAFRAEALAEIGKVKWLPDWAESRITGTVESRPDWCISRQRTWGVPLPVFTSADGEVILDAEVARRVATLVEEKGTNLWFEKDDLWWNEQLGLPEGTERGKDTLDVWIDSGCSHVAVVDRHPELRDHGPADLYLEATDQHRGWFQSSLMVRVATKGEAPYKSVLTHGFVVDTSGRKISKSGKPMNASHFFDQYGADNVRLWVSSVDWTQEVPFSDKLFAQVTETYRRVRNTFRVLLGNLSGFDPAAPAAEPTLVDRWILERLHAVTGECLAAYAEYDFHKVYVVLNQFCSQDLSALYVDLTKDRLYCDASESPRRRASQAAMATVFDSLCRLFAPILAYTADEAWQFAGHEESVHLEDFPEPDPACASGEATAAVEKLLRLRALVQKEVEPLRQAKEIKGNADASVELSVSDEDDAGPILDDPEALAEFLIVAKVSVTRGAAQSKAVVSVSPEEKCPRCWRRVPAVGDHGLCARCDSAISS